MSCQACNERRQAVRDAWLNGEIARAVAELAKGAAELAGLKAKPETEAKAKD